MLCHPICNWVYIHFCIYINIPRLPYTLLCLYQYQDTHIPTEDLNTTISTFCSISTSRDYPIHFCIYINIRTHTYGVASISRLLKIIGLLCKRALWKRLYSAKETYNFTEPTDRSHPICRAYMYIWVCIYVCVNMYV